MSALRLSSALVIGLALVQVGCGGGNTGTVSGSVTAGGEPIAFGSIGFITPEGWAGSAPIRDGKYSLTEIPPGPAKITVLAVPPPPAMAPPPTPGASPSQPTKLPPFRPIPELYSDASKTPLTYEVKAGDQTHDVDVPMQ